ncbi:MAG: NUDIX domain-containing protein [Candidatus Nomurabacteria bacterium]|nr:NUDIX domain-containing protein [Candidatus Nomurabacteria bacterium]
MEKNHQNQNLQQKKEPKPIKQKNNRLNQFKKFFGKGPLIKKIVREPTAGGIIFRIKGADVEVLLIQDAKYRWTIPKGHIELGESPKETAVREIAEETGLKNVQVLSWLGKVEFKYRRQDRLVLMTTQVYLMKALDDHEGLQKEKWMHSIRWFSFKEALDKIEYDDISKLLLLAKNRIKVGEK